MIFEVRALLSASIIHRGIDTYIYIELYSSLLFGGTGRLYMLHIHGIAVCQPLALEAGQASLKLRVRVCLYCVHARGGEICWMEQAIGYDIFHKLPVKRWKSSACFNCIEQL